MGINTDGAPGDVLDCGDGTDGFTADPGDEVRDDCETGVTGGLPGGRRLAA